MSDAPPDPHSNNDQDVIELEERKKELDNIQSNFPLVLCPYEDQEYMKDLNAHLGKDDKEDFKRILHAHLLSNGSKCNGWTVDDLKSAMKESYGYDDNKEVDTFVRENFQFASLKLFVDKASDVARVDSHGFVYPVLNDDNRELYEDAVASVKNKDDKERKKDEAVSRRLEDPEKIRGYYVGVNQLQKAILQAQDKCKDRDGTLAYIKAADGSGEEVVGVLYSHFETVYKELFNVDLSKECKSVCGRSSVMKALTQGQLKCLMDTIIMQNFTPAEAAAGGWKAGAYIGLKSGHREYSEAEIQAAEEECRQQHGAIEQKQNARYERQQRDQAEPPRANYNEMRRRLEEQSTARASNAPTAAPAAAPSTAPAPVSTSAQPSQQRAAVSDSENSDDDEQAYSDMDDEEMKAKAKKKKEKREKKERERSISSASVSEHNIIAPPTTNPSLPPTPTATAAPAEDSRTPTPPAVPYPEEAMRAATSALTAGRQQNLPPGTNHRVNQWEDDTAAVPAPLVSTPSPPVPVSTPTPTPLLPTEYSPSAVATPTPQPVQQQYNRDELLALARPQPTPQQGDPQFVQGVQYPPPQQYDQQSFMQQQQQPQMQQMQQSPFLPQQQQQYDPQYAPQGQYMAQPAPVPAPVAVVGGQKRIQAMDGTWYWVSDPAPPPAAAPAAAPATTTPPPQHTVSPIINVHLNNNMGQPGTTTTYTVNPNQPNQPMITTATQGDLTQQTLPPTQAPTPSPYGVPQGQGVYPNAYPSAPPSTYGGHGGYAQPQQAQQQYPPNQNWQDPAGYAPPGQPGYHHQYQQGGMAPPPAPPSTVPYEPLPRQSAFPTRGEYDHPQPPQHHQHQQQRRPDYDYPPPQQQHHRQQQPLPSHYADPQQHLAQQRAPPPRHPPPAPVYRDQLRDEGDEERRRRLQMLGPEVGNARRRPVRADEAFVVPPPRPARHENQDDDWDYSDEFNERHQQQRPRYDQLGGGPRPPLGPPRGSSTPLNQTQNMWAFFNELTTPRKRVRWLVISTLKNVMNLNEQRSAAEFELIDYERLLAHVTACSGNEMEMYTALEDMTITFMRFLVDMEHDGLIHMYIGEKPVPGTNCIKLVMYVSDPFNAPPAEAGLRRANSYVR